MNKETLQQIFQQYIDKFTFLNAEPQEEYYKWQVCREYPGLMKAALESDNDLLPRKLYEAKKSTYNIIDSYTQPFSGLVDLAKEDPDSVRKMLLDLYSDDGGDIKTQMEIISDFFNRSSELVQKYYPESFRYKQDSHSVSALLFLKDPDHHYMFKATHCLSFAECVEFYDDWGAGNIIKLDVFYRFCDELLEEIKADKALMSTDESRFDSRIAYKGGELHPDTEKHILLFDIIYCCSAYGLYDGVSFTKRNAAEKKLYKENKETARKLKAEYDQAVEDDEKLRNTLLELADMIKPGMKVKTKKHGEGVVDKADDRYVTATFDDGTTEIGLPIGLSNKILVFESNEVSDKADSVKSLLKNYKEIPKRVEQKSRALKPYEEYL